MTSQMQLFSAFQVVVDDADVVVGRKARGKRFLNRLFSARLYILAKSAAIYLLHLEFHCMYITTIRIHINIAVVGRVW